MCRTILRDAGFIDKNMGTLEASPLIHSQRTDSRGARQLRSPQTKSLTCKANYGNWARVKLKSETPWWNLIVQVNNVPSKELFLTSHTLLEIHSRNDDAKLSSHLFYHYFFHEGLDTRTPIIFVELEKSWRLKESNDWRRTSFVIFTTEVYSLTLRWFM